MNRKTFIKSILCGSVVAPFVKPEKKEKFEFDSWVLVPDKNDTVDVVGSPANEHYRDAVEFSKFVVRSWNAINGYPINSRYLMGKGIK